MNKNQISELLAQIGTNPAYKGYSYLIHVIYLASSEGDGTFLTLKRLYADTSQHFNVSPDSIQHSVRTLLDAYWNQDNTKYFYDTVKYPVHGPLPPKEFISVLSNYIRRKQ